MKIIREKVTSDKLQEPFANLWARLIFYPWLVLAELAEILFYTRSLVAFSCVKAEILRSKARRYP